MKILAFACLLAVGKSAFLTVLSHKNAALFWRLGKFVLGVTQRQVANYTEASGKFHVVSLFYLCL